MSEPALPEAFEASCGECRFFRAADVVGGSCHRFPPGYAGDSSPRETPRWRHPTVGSRGWCGEFQPRRGPGDLRPAASDLPPVIKT